MNRDREAIVRTVRHELQPRKLAAPTPTRTYENLDVDLTVRLALAVITVTVTVTDSDVPSARAPDCGKWTHHAYNAYNACNRGTDIRQRPEAQITMRKACGLYVMVPDLSCFREKPNLASP